jgi:hypothetical protein
VIFLFRYGFFFLFVGEGNRAWLVKGSSQSKAIHCGHWIDSMGQTYWEDDLDRSQARRILTNGQWVLFPRGLTLTRRAVHVFITYSARRVWWRGPRDERASLTLTNKKILKEKQIRNRWHGGAPPRQALRSYPGSSLNWIVTCLLLKFIGRAPNHQIRPSKFSFALSTYWPVFGDTSSIYFLSNLIHYTLILLHFYWKWDDLSR